MAEHLKAEAEVKFQPEHFLTQLEKLELVSLNLRSTAPNFLIAILNRDGLILN